MQIYYLRLKYYPWFCHFNHINISPKTKTINKTLSAIFRENNFKH